MKEEDLIYRRYCNEFAAGERCQQPTVNYRRIARLDNICWTLHTNDILIRINTAKFIT